MTDEIDRQISRTLEILDRVQPLVCLVGLGKVGRARIAAYESSTGRSLPHDFARWITDAGAGTIDLVHDEVVVRNLDEGREFDDCWTTPDDPAGSSILFNLTYGGEAAVIALDTRACDAVGAAPVVVTLASSMRVREVLASSWTAYVARRLIEAAKDAPDRADYNDLRKWARAIDQETFDDGLVGARERVSEAMNRVMPPAEIALLGEQRRQGLSSIAGEIAAPFEQPLTASDAQTSQLQPTLLALEDHLMRGRITTDLQVLAASNPANQPSRTGSASWNTHGIR
jgi:hypothetical protein